MKILLIGATGMLGRRIAAEARSRGHKLSEVTRSGADGTQTADAGDASAVAAIAAGHDAVVVAVAPPRDGSDRSDSLLAAGRGALRALPEAGVRRLVVVGGADQLLVDADGKSAISAEDYAVAVADELENARAVGRRISVAC